MRVLDIKPAKEGELLAESLVVKYREDAYGASKHWMDEPGMHPVFLPGDYILIGHNDDGSLYARSCVWYSPYRNSVPITKDEFILVFNYIRKEDQDENYP